MVAKSNPARNRTAAPPAVASGGATDTARRASRRASVSAAPALEALPGGLPEFDRIIHERIRLGIVSALAGTESHGFSELKRLLKTTDGNLSVHARKLEEAGYISCTKFFEGRTPRTEYKLTPAGRRALERYLDHMEGLIAAMRGR